MIETNNYRIVFIDNRGKPNQHRTLRNATESMARYRMYQFLRDYDTLRPARLMRELPNKSGWEQLEEFE